MSMWSDRHFALFDLPDVDLDPLDPYDDFVDDEPGFDLDAVDVEPLPEPEDLDPGPLPEELVFLEGGYCWCDPDDWKRGQ